MNEPTPEQALAILNQVRLECTLKGREHEAAIVAVQVLERSLAELKSLKQPPPKKEECNGVAQTS